MGVIFAPTMEAASAYSLGRYGSYVYKIEELTPWMPTAETAIGGGVRILLSSEETWDSGTREKYRRFRRGN